MSTARPASAEKPTTERLTLAEAMPELKKGLRRRRKRTAEEIANAEEALRQLWLQSLQLLYPDHPEMVEQLYYAKPRQFRADYAFKDQRVLVEIEGGIYGGEGHGGDYKGVVNDLRRSRYASAHGWRVFRVSRACLEKEPGDVFDQLRNTLEYSP